MRSRLAPAAGGACGREAQRVAVAHAAKRAGLHCVYTLNEPTAAAFCHGITKALLDVCGGESVELVVDVGGGTLDNTLLKMSKIPDGDGASVRQDGASVPGKSKLVFAAAKSTGKRIGGEHVTTELAALMEAEVRTQAATVEKYTSRNIVVPDPLSAADKADLLQHAEAAKCILGHQSRADAKVKRQAIAIAGESFAVPAAGRGATLVVHPWCIRGPGC